MSTVYKLFNGGMVINFVSCCIAVGVSHHDLGIICMWKIRNKSGNLIVIISYGNCVSKTSHIDHLYKLNPHPWTLGRHLWAFGAVTIMGLSGVVIIMGLSGVVTIMGLSKTLCNDCTPSVWLGLRATVWRERML